MKPVWSQPLKHNRVVSPAKFYQTIVFITRTLNRTNALGPTPKPTGSVPQTPGPKSCTLNPYPKLSFGHWSGSRAIPRCRLPACSRPLFRVSGFGFQVSGFGFGVLGFGFRI
jgi:hypothetical protein